MDAGAGERPRHTMRKRWRDAASREWRCNRGDRVENRDADAMEWQNERATGRAGKWSFEKASGRNVREVKDRHTKYKLFVHNRDKLKITTRLQETERVYGGKWYLRDKVRNAVNTDGPGDKIVTLVCYTDSPNHLLCISFSTTDFREVWLLYLCMRYLRFRILNEFL